MGANIIACALSLDFGEIHCLPEGVSDILGIQEITTPPPPPPLLASKLSKGLDKSNIFDLHVFLQSCKGVSLAFRFNRGEKDLAQAFNLGVAGVDKQSEGFAYLL